MANNYNISPDGLITRLNEDGSVTMLAKVDENGKINGPDGKSLQKTVVKTRTQTKTVTRHVDVVPGWSVAVMILLAIVAIGGVISCCDSKDELESAEHRLHNLKEELSSAESMASWSHYYSGICDGVAKTHPLVVRKVEIGNDGEGFGGWIYSYETTYLTPKIICYGLKSGTVKLGVCLYRPDGSLSTGSSSRDGYSYYTDVFISDGLNEKTLTGWGSNQRGHWSSGRYLIEIYYEGRILAKKWFYVS